MSFTINNISFKYENKSIIENLSFEFDSGKVTTIVGPNGSGKTTILKLLSGILKPQKGNILCKNKDLKFISAKERAKLIASVPQNMPLSLDFTVENMIANGRSAFISGIYGKTTQDYNAIEEAMKIMDLLHLRDCLCSEISGGELQRTIIAMALAQETQFLLLDEPTSSLDILHTSNLMEKIKSFAKERNIGIFIITHDLSIAARYSDKLILFKAGKIIAQGMPSDILNKESIYNTFTINTEILYDSKGNILIS